MASPQSSAPASSPALERSAAPAAPVGPAARRPLPPSGRRPPVLAPPATRRDPVRPGGRPARMDGVAAARPVRGGCAPGAGGRFSGGVRPAGPAPLRLTRRGRRALSGLSIAIGLSIAVATAAVELGHSDGGLELAGSATVVVQAGDTLWSLAQELAPEQDPRAVVDAIVEANDLDGVGLVPGQVLQLP